MSFIPNHYYKIKSEVFLFINEKRIALHVNLNQDCKNKLKQISEMIEITQSQNDKTPNK